MFFGTAACAKDPSKVAQASIEVLITDEKRIIDTPFRGPVR
jgi:hypothetical protein